MSAGQVVGCRRCPARIFFVRPHNSASMMPFDEAVARADTVPSKSRWTVDPVARQWCGPAQYPAEFVYVPHWGTCPSTNKKPPRNAVLRQRWIDNGGIA